MVQYGKLEYLEEDILGKFGLLTGIRDEFGFTNCLLSVLTLVI